MVSPINNFLNKIAEWFRQEPTPDQAKVQKSVSFPKEPQVAKQSLLNRLITWIQGPVKTITVRGPKGPMEVPVSSIKKNNTWTSESFNFEDIHPDSPRGLSTSVQKSQLALDINRATYVVDGVVFEPSNPANAVDELHEWLKSKGVTDGQIDCLGIFSQQGVISYPVNELSKNGISVQIGAGLPSFQQYAFNVTNEGVAVRSTWLANYRNFGMGVEKPEVLGVVCLQSEAFIPDKNTKQECLVGSKITYGYSPAFEYKEPLDPNRSDFLQRFKEKGAEVISFANDEGTMPQDLYLRELGSKSIINQDNRTIGTFISKFRDKPEWEKWGARTMAFLEVLNNRMLNPRPKQTDIAFLENMYGRLIADLEQDPKTKKMVDELGNMQAGPWNKFFEPVAEKVEELGG